MKRKRRRLIVFYCYDFSKSEENPPLDRTPEWSTACAHIQSHMDFDLITIPWLLKGLTHVETGWGPSKTQNGSNKRKQGQDAADKRWLNGITVLNATLVIIT